MSSTVLSPRIDVDSDALDVFSAFARMRGLSVGEALADYVNSFRPKSSGVRVVGRDADGPILIFRMSSCIRLSMRPMTP